jgi:hypothetical protein
MAWGIISALLALPGIQGIGGPLIPSDFLLAVLFFLKEEHNKAVCQAKLRSRHSRPS